MSKFVIPKGHCSGAYDAVYISTDLEPDDAAALKLLAPRLHGVPLLIIVGEGDKPKTELMCNLLRQYGLDEQATVVQGRRSSVVYPPAALASYTPTEVCPPSKATVSDVAGDDQVAAAVQSFLLGHSAPFALVLKPPYELLKVSKDALGRSVSAAYGSFNFTSMRESMRNESPNLTEDEAFGRQEAMLRSFKRCLWLERSVSVGRDATLDPAPASAAVWSHLAGDASLLRIIGAWNEKAVAKFARSLSELGQQIGGAFDQSGNSAFASIEKLAANAEKKASMILSIAQHGGLQMPLADPLVIASLVDDSAEIVPFERRCRAGHDAKGRPTFDALDTSSVCTLYAEGAEQRQLLYAATIRVLGAALPTAGGTS